MTRTWPAEAPSPHQFNYRCFTADMDEDKAVTRFRDLFGRWPEWVIESLGLLWVGPIEKGESDG